ncbi:30S ribosomal protein S6 [Longimonas halophila]|jgi:small subunit ribosomal protein S6|uniref:Small ribosomal subunit protein bS6 n=1 Tax=Longimonas halophila TaxID=1469170 RepID=A0A2H3NRD6_9BACT|nr:30S ribosomal protein S6 [Longimonas halophila]PEN09632.1 30S ribosomal protein S6 [Longimonas halophila]
MASENMYELTYIISGVAQQNQVDDIVNSVNKFVREHGTLEYVDEWGNQRLAYEIDKKRSGYYVNLYFKAEGKVVPQLERQLQLNDQILRYLTLRMDAKMIRHYERQQSTSAVEEAAEASEDA